MVEADVRRRVAGGLERAPGAEHGVDHRPVAQLRERRQRAERGVALLPHVGVVVHLVLRHALGERAALARGVDPDGVESAVGERLVRGVHPHRAAALLDDPHRHAEVVGVRVGEHELADVPDLAAALLERDDERVPGARVARAAAVDQRDPAVVAVERVRVDVGDPRPREGQPERRQARADLEGGRLRRVDRPVGGNGTDHAPILAAQSPAAASPARTPKTRAGPSVPPAPG